MIDLLPQKTLKLNVVTKISSVSSYLERCKLNEEAKTDMLDIRWWKGRDGRKRYAICCKCGNIRMIKADLGIRCHLCNTFHNYDTWNKLRIKVHALARFGGDKILRIEQSTNKSMRIDKEVF